MLHKITPISDAPQVQRLLRIQRALIEFVCHAENPLVYCADAELAERIYETCPDHEIAAWLNRAPKLRRLAQSIAQHLHEHPDERRQLSEAFNHDIEYRRHLEDPEYHFEFADLDKDLRDSLKEFMVYLYDNLGSGYSSALVQSDRPFSRTELMKLWDARNNDLRACPMCDGSPPSSVNGKRLSDLDHFLPKTRYPFLSVHPSNLVPVCLECNQRIKGEKDPLEINGSIKLANSFHPYAERPAHEQIEVTWECPDAGPLVVRIKEPKAEEPSPRIASLNRLLALEERWAGRWKEMEDEVYELVANWPRLLDRHSTMPDNANKIDWISTALRTRANRIKPGTRSYRIIYRSFIGMLAEEPKQLARLLARIPPDTQ